MGPTAAGSDLDSEGLLAALPPSTLAPPHWTSEEPRPCYPSSHGALIQWAPGGAAWRTLSALHTGPGELWSQGHLNEAPPVGRNGR